MTVIRMVLAIIMVTVLPAMIGTIYLPIKEKGTKWLFAWICGQISLWAGFLFVCVPMVLFYQEFVWVKRVYFMFCAAATVLATVIYFFRRGKKSGGEAGKKARGVEKIAGKRTSIILWCIFAALILIQVFCVFYLSYEDGDDSYYVAITTYGKEVGTLYRNVPYTGVYTELDFRHSLAPFPVWVAVWADVAGLSGAVTAHVLMPLLILAITYGLFYLLGEGLFGEGTREDSWKMPLFMCFSALLVLFGGYSIYSAENFLIVRAGQGKAVLANVVIPALLYAALLLLQRLEKKEKTPVSLWLLFCAIMTTGCLCSTLGSFLLCVFLGIVALCALVVYRRWRMLPGVAAAFIVPATMAALYVFFG